jgi:hypothetical protein
VVGLTTCKPSYSDCLEIWETQSTGPFKARPYLYREMFTSILYMLERTLEECEAIQMRCAVSRPVIKAGTFRATSRIVSEQTAKFGLFNLILSSSFFLFSIKRKKRYEKKRKKKVQNLFQAKCLENARTEGFQAVSSCRNGKSRLDRRKKLGSEEPNVMGI